MFKEDKWISAAAAAVNLISSIILVQFMGVEGVLLGTLFALGIYWIGRSYVVNRKCFEGNMSVYVRYWGLNVIYTAAFIVITCCVKYVIQYIVIGNPIIQFICRGFVAEGVIAVLIILFFGRTRNMQKAFNMIVKPYLQKVMKGTEKHEEK